MDRLGDLNIVLGQPQEVFARNLTPEYLAQLLSTIMSTLSENLPPQKINNSIGVEVKFSSTKQEINLLYKNKLDESLKPSFTIINEKLHNIHLKSTKEPLSLMIMFDNAK